MAASCGRLGPVGEHKCCLSIFYVLVGGCIRYMQTTKSIPKHIQMKKNIKIYMQGSKIHLFYLLYYICFGNHLSKKKELVDKFNFEQLNDKALNCLTGPPVPFGMLSQNWQFFNLPPFMFCIYNLSSQTPLNITPGLIQCKSKVRNLQ